MTRDTDSDTSAFDHSDKLEIIDHIYQVAIDPERYENLLDIWEERLGPTRGLERMTGNGSPQALIRDNELENHFARASTVLDKLATQSPEQNLQNLVDAFERAAAFTVSAAGQLTAVNAAAQATLRIMTGQPVTALPIEAAETDLLAREIARLASPEGRSSSFTRFRLADSARPIVVRLSRIDEAFAGGTSVLAVTSEMAWPENLSTTVMEAFGLTATEVEVLRALVEGAGIKEIAERRDRSQETVKTQVRSILAKTETRAQAELVRVTLGLMDVVAVTDRKAGLKTLVAGGSKLEPRPFRSLQRPDGRRSDHIVIGDENGRPVLYLPLDYGLIRWPASAEKVAQQRGLKVIVPVRPGYGHSTQVRDRSHLTDAVVSDLLALLDHYEVETCPVIALSTDAFFAYHMAQRHPGRLSAIINCSAGLPFSKRSQYERMHKWHRFIIANARYAPAMLPFMVKAGFSLARRIGKRGFVHAVYGGSQADVDTFEDPEVMEAMVLGSEVCLSEWHSAHDAFANEVIIQQTDWRDLVLSCKIPVHIWQGHYDPQMPMATIREMQADFPDIRFHEDERAGQLIFFKDWPQILRQVEQYIT